MDNNIIYKEAENKDNDDSNDDLKKFYLKNGYNVHNNIYQNIKKIKKEEELLNLRKIVKDLKIKNQKIQNELALLKNKDIKLERDDNEINKNRKLYLNIKNIFNKTENNIINNNTKINIDDILNFYKFKFSFSSSFREKIKFFRKIYLDEKIKNSLIEKTYKLFLENNIVNENINNSNINKNILDGINNLIKKIDKIKQFNEEIQLNINGKNIEKKKYNFYYIYWEKLLNVNKKEDVKKRIHDLIDDLKYNDIEESKLYNILTP